MSVFTWNDSYQIGDDNVDAQHRHLFELANQMVEATDNELIRLLMSFYRHVREHFEAEEDLMKQVGFPDYKNHVQEHDQMLDRLVEISKAVQLKQWSANDIRAFIDSWVLSHILQKDSIIGEHLKTL
ncbi:MAG: hemerythrin family protein [Methylomonas sp.]|nr:hemerythrin family protein [Methylomonas sp.]